MTPQFFTSFILVNIFKIPTNLFLTLIQFFRKTSAIATATLPVTGVPVEYPREFKLEFDGAAALPAGSGIDRLASAGLRKFKPVLIASQELLDWGWDWLEH